MQPTEKIAQAVSELHALALLSKGEPGASGLELMRVQVAIEDFAGADPALTKEEIGEAARRGVQRVAQIAYA